jgi:hypothetical protein
MIGGMQQTPDPADGQGRADLPREHHRDIEVRVRRSPKFGAFMLIGAVLGALSAWVISAIQPPGVNEAGQPVDTTGVLGLALVAGVVLGVAIGAVVALLVDRSLAKRGRMLIAEQTDVEAPEQPRAAVAPADAGEASFEHLADGTTAPAGATPVAGLPGDGPARDARPSADRRDDDALRDDDGQERDRPSGA